MVSIFLFIITPFISVALGVLLFSKLPIGVAVGFTILMFLPLFFGLQYLSSMWQVRIHAPAKAIEYESMLSSRSPDSSGAVGLDLPYVFALGLFGHIVCILGVVVAFFSVSKGMPVLILASGFLALGGLIWLLVRCSKLSPFFAPPLIADPDGIRSQKYFIPWQDVVNVLVGAAKGQALYVETARGTSCYRIGGDGREVPGEGRRVQVPSFGMWPEDAAQYLQLRARLSRGIDKSKT